MSIVTPLRRPAPSAPTPSARSALAERIAVCKAAELEYKGLEAALTWNGTARRAESAARDRLQAAEEALEAAKQGAADRLVQQALGGAMEAGQGVKQARAEIAAAEDDLNSALAARATLEARLEPARDALTSAQLRVDEAAFNVVREHIAPCIDALFAETDALYRRAAENSNLIAWLSGTVLPRSGPKAHPRMIEISCRFTNSPSSWNSSRPELSALRAAWQSSLDALKLDANAKLPAVVS